QLGADVDLLAPVLAAAGDLQPGASVAAEMRGVHHLDSQLLLLGQLEEAPGEPEDAVDPLLCDAVAGQIEEPDVARRRPQIRKEALPLARAALEPSQVEHRQIEGRAGGLVHGLRLPDTAV